MLRDDQECKIHLDTHNSKKFNSSHLLIRENISDVPHVTTSQLNKRALLWSLEVNKNNCLKNLFDKNIFEKVPYYLKQICT